MNNYIVRPGIVLINIYGTVFLAADREARKKCAFIRELNEVGAFIWTRLEKGDNYDSIVSEVKKEYEVPEEYDIDRDIKIFLKELEDNGYIKSEE